MNLYIIRHGQTETNRGARLLGIIDEGINEYGRKQAIEAREQIKDLKFDICFSSPFKRTIETAEILLENRTPIVIDERIKERGFGELEGGSVHVEYVPDFWDYYLNRSDYGVEPLQDLFKRTKEFIKYIKQNFNNKNVLVVSHGATIRALHYNIVGFDRETDMLSFKASNAQFFKYKL